MKFKIAFFWLMICSISSITSQEILTKQEALQITLENNFGVKVANNNLAVAKNNSSVFNTNSLPNITATTGANFRSDNQDVVFQNGNVTSIDGAITKSYNASVNLNYTIFDGFGRMYNTKQLQETYNLTQLQARQTIENASLQLFTAYYQIARLTQNLENLKNALQISKTRFKRADYQYQFGQTTKLELLNAEVDLNTDSIAVVTIKQQLNSAKRNLNLILGLDKDINYQVDTIINFNMIDDYKTLEEKALKNNAVLLQSESNVAIREFQEKITKSTFLPSINLNTSYGWNRNINPPTSFLAEFNNVGLNAGINLVWNIFDGGLTKTRIANAKIAIENEQILVAQQKTTLMNTLKDTWENYYNQLYILQAQEQNVLTNQNNFDRSEERFKLGQINSVEFRQAQINLIFAKNALNNAKFDAKLIEIQLLQLSGDLLNANI